ncbi:MAG: peptidase M41, partial [Bacteroidales bacterium]|nr:peptidase M41 [Bacteroidales bacterium]
ITKQAYAMVSYFGMSDKIGNISFYDSSGQGDFGFTKPYSEKTAELIDQEVKEIIEESYQRALDVLKKNMKGLKELAELLLEKEVIFSEDLERIFGKRKADLVKMQENKSASGNSEAENEAENKKPASSKAGSKNRKSAVKASERKKAVDSAPAGGEVKKKKSGKIKKQVE